MDGLEKLREYAQLVVKNGSCAPMIAFYADPRCGDASVRCDDCRSLYLQDIADQIKIEQAEAQAAYDWVEANGGLDEVRHHLAFMTEQVANRVGVERKPDEPEHVTIGRILDEIDKRLMPEGMEWPRFEDGEQVQFGEKFVRFDGKHGNDGEYITGVTIIGGNCCTYRINGDYHGRERVKRPESKVLGADRLPIEVGQTVFFADGSNATAYEVAEISQGLYLSVRVRIPGSPEHDGQWFDPQRLSHTPPDTQERIDADTWKDATDYCREYNVEHDFPKHAGKAKCEHLLRRQRELDGRTMGGAK